MGQLASQEKCLNVGSGLLITISYRFTDQEMNLLGSSEHSGDYTFLFGAGDTIPGLEKHLEGAELGETRTFVISAKDAYGVYKTDLRHSVAKSSFPKDLELQVGRMVYINNKEMKIVGLDEHNVTVDENHPLAGKELHFTTKVHSIQEEFDEQRCSCNNSCSCKDD